MKFIEREIRDRVYRERLKLEFVERLDNIDERL